jgi:hypothetical protein
VTEPGPGYQLAFDPDGASFTVRGNLVDIIEREILGPAGGPEELLPVSPRQLYLVGHIAPVKLTEPEADPDGSEDGYGLVGVRSDAAAGHAQRGIPAEAADGADIDGEEDDVDDKAPKQGLMIPSSMGLRFQVPNGLAEFTVTASWGTYESVKTGAAVSADSGRDRREDRGAGFDGRADLHPAVDR